MRDGKRRKKEGERYNEKKNGWEGRDRKRGGGEREDAKEKRMK